MDRKQLELMKIYKLCSFDIRDDGLFYEKGSSIPFTGEKVGYDTKYFGLAKDKKRIEITLKDGKQHGPMKAWHKNGNKWLEMEYHEGKPHKLRKRWYEDGYIEEETLFEYGEIIKQKFSPNIEILQLCIKLYNQKLTMMEVGPEFIKSDKKSIESFLFHEYAIAKEKMQNLSGVEKMYQNQFIGIIDSHKNEIIEYISNNV